MTNDDKYFKPAINTDQTIYRQPTTDYGPEDGNDSGIEPSVFVTKEGRVGFNHYGKCVVKSIKEWVDMAWNTPQQPSEPLKALESDWEIQFDEKFGLKEKMRIYDNAKTAMEKIALKSGGLDFQISYLLCIKEWIRSKFGQPSEKKALSVERIEEILLTKHGQYLLTENAKQLAQAIESALPARKEVNWPERLPSGKRLYAKHVQDYDDGWNACLDACIKAYEEAMPAQREVRYPEKITYYHSKKEYPQNCVDAHNEAIDKFKKLNGG